MTNPIFKGHSASWIAGYKEAEHKAHIQQIAHAADHWIQDQNRIDREAWLVVQGILIGCVLVIVAYVAGKLA